MVFYNRKITCLLRLLHMHSAGSLQARQAAEICDGPSLPARNLRMSLPERTGDWRRSDKAMKL